MSVGNVGGSPISGPVVDNLPAGLAAVVGTVTDGGVISDGGRVITWHVNLAPGTTQVFTYQAPVGATVTDGLILENVVTFQGLKDRTQTPVELPPVLPIEEEETVAAEEEELADTGARNVGNVISAALLAMLAGGLMVSFGRRRRNEG